MLTWSALFFQRMMLRRSSRFLSAALVARTLPLSHTLASDATQSSQDITLLAYASLVNNVASLVVVNRLVLKVMRNCGRHCGLSKLLGK
jgi:hypothetical protein